MRPPPIEVSLVEYNIKEIAMGTVWVNLHPMLIFRLGESKHVPEEHASEVQLEANVEEHVPECRRARTNECASSRQAHLMPKSVHNPSTCMSPRCVQPGSTPRGMRRGAHAWTQWSVRQVAHAF